VVVVVAVGDGVVVVDDEVVVELGEDVGWRSEAFVGHNADKHDEESDRKHRPDRAHPSRHSERLRH
jgi:hypothetical protein